MRINREFPFLETLLLSASLTLVSLAGLTTHRWLWGQAELLSYRSAVQQVAGTVRQMRVRAVNARQSFVMHIDTAARRLQLMAIDTAPGLRESLEQTIWLPPGLVIAEAPEQLLVSPAGAMAPASLLFEAAAFQRLFRVRMSSSGVVQLYEEPST